LAINESSGVPFGHIPAYLPGSSSLVEELDKRVLIVLRDGKHLIGVRTGWQQKTTSRSQRTTFCELTFVKHIMYIQTLASFDQFNNLVLLQTVERRIVRMRPNEHTMVQCFYCDIPLGTFLVRGDSMVLMGAVEDDDGEDDEYSNLRPVSSLAELVELQKIAESAVQWDFDGDLIA
jgi:U6 snRNA-associated Sm-like protein LSm1